MMNPTLWRANRKLEICPSQMWYLMLDSDVRPNRGKIDDPRVTGKNRNAQHMCPMYPSLNDTLRNFASHLQIKHNTTHVLIKVENTKQRVENKKSTYTFSPSVCM